MNTNVIIVLFNTYAPIKEPYMDFVFVGQGYFIEGDGHMLMTRDYPSGNFYTI